MTGERHGMHEPSSPPAPGPFAVVGVVEAPAARLAL